MQHDLSLWRRLPDACFGDESPQSQALRIEQVAVLSRGTPTMALGNMLNAAITGAVLFQIASPLALGPWIGLVWLAACQRLLRWRRNRGRAHPVAVRRRTLLRATVWSGLFGAFWGTLAIALLPRVPAVYQVFIAFVIGGQAAAASTWLAPLFPAFLAYLIASMAPLILGFAVHNSVMGHAMAAMLAAYSAVQVHFAHQAGRSFRDRVRTGQERERLIGALQASRDGIEREVAARTEELRSVNAQLSAEIAERKRTEEELWASQRLLRTVVDAIPYSLTAKDAQGRYLLINAAMASMWRCAPESLIGKTPHDIPGILPADAERMSRADRLVLAEGIGSELPQVAITLRDGTRSHRRAVRAPIFDGRDRVTGLVVLSEDITARVEAEEKLEASRRLLQSVIDTIPHAVFAKDTAGRFILVNKFFADTAGLTPQQMIGMHALNLPGAVPALLNEALAEDREVLITGMPAIREAVPGLFGNAAERWRRSVKLPLRDEAGRVVGLVGLVEDITDRYLAERRVRDSRRLLQSVIDTIPHDVYAKDTNHRYILANKHFADSVSLTPERMVGLNLRDLPGTVPKILEQTLAADREVLATGKPVIHEEMAALIEASADRRFRHIKLPLKDEAGRVAGVVGLVEDITDRYRAERRVKDSQRLLQSVIDSIPYSVFAKDLGGRYILTNERGAAMAGLTPERMIGRRIEEIPGTRPEAVQESHALDKEVATTGRPVVREAVQGYFGLSTDRWRRLVKQPLRNEAGEIVGTVGVGEDITERHLAEQRVRESRLLLQTVFDALPVWVFVKDRERRTVMINRQMAAGYGVEPGAPPPPDLSAGLPEDIRERIAGYDQSVLNSGQPYEVPEMPVALPGQPPRIMRVLRLPLRDGQGKIAGLVGVLEDITERKHAAEAMLQMQKLESLGSLAGGIAHNFNNLLSGILGHVALALYDPGLSGDTRASLQTVTNAARQAADLAEQMLAYSGRGKLQVGPLSLNELVSGMMPLLQVTVPRTARIALRCRQDLPAVVCDASQLRQLIVNVIKNAAEAIGKEAGEIALTTGCVRVSREQLDGYHLAGDTAEGDYVFLEVTDSGPGMTPEVLSRVFDPFFTTRPGAHGLGLPAALGIVRGHQGAIRVTSRPGAGTSVRILLPAVAAAQGGTEPAERLWSRDGAVLVVDDEPAVRQLTAMTLRELGLSVIEAGCGEEAVRLLREHGSAVEWALVDASMPGMSGPSTLRALRSLAPNLPAVVVSGKNEPELLEQFDGLAIRGILRKPFSLTDLQAQLKAWLNPPQQVQASA